MNFFQRILKRVGLLVVIKEEVPVDCEMKRSNPFHFSTEGDINDISYYIKSIDFYTGNVVIEFFSNKDLVIDSSDFKYTKIGKNTYNFNFSFL